MVDSIGGWRRTGRVFASVAVWSVAACRDGAKLGVGVQPLRAPLNTATVRYRIEAGVRTWAVTLPPKTDSRGRDERRDSDEFDTPRTGAARVSFTLVLPDGRQISSGEVTIPLKRDWRWGVELQARTGDPRSDCFGCFGSKSFALPEQFRSAGRDSLWLVWGGNSNSDPVVY